MKKLSMELRNKITEEITILYNDIIDIDNIQLSSYYADRDSIVKQLNEYPLAIINSIMPDIKYERYEFDAYLDTDEDVEWGRPVNVYENYKISDFILVTDIDGVNYEFIHDDGTVFNSSEVGIDVDIDKFDYFTGDINLKGVFSPQQPEMDLYLLENCGRLKCYMNVCGISRDGVTPGWVYYLAEGCVTYICNNEKMAILNIFSALDNFIEYLYNKVFEYYLSQYNNLIDYSKEVNSFEEAECDKVCIINKIRNFAKDTKRLDEKLKDIMREVNIKGDNVDFKKLCNINKSYFDKIEKVRNKVAHGELYSVNEINFGECLYYILTIMLSILYVHDFEADEWNIIKE